MTTLRYVLRQSLDEGATFQHLALFDDAVPGAGPVAHWVLPKQPSRGIQQPHSLLAEAPKGMPLPDQELDAGSCALVSTRLPLTADVERVRLTLRGRHMCGHYAMQRLRPGGSCWLFGPLQFVPDAQRNLRRGAFVAPQATRPVA